MQHEEVWLNSSMKYNYYYTTWWISYVVRQDNNDVWFSRIGETHYRSQQQIKAQYSQHIEAQ